MKLLRILAAMLPLCALTACNDVDEQARYAGPITVEAKKNVLLEDFTGQMCTNCPKAHSLITSLREQYGEKVIAVAIHAGNFGIAENSMPGVIGLMLPEGDDYAKKAGIEAYPSGVINRHTNVLRYTEWASYVRDELERESFLNIELKANIEDGKIFITTELKPIKDINGKLQLWITENNIVTLQVDEGKYLMDYVHNHVYRGSVNGIWGEDVNLKANVFSNTKHQLEVKDGWNADNLSVVAFVYNDNDGVYQVTECSVE